MHNQQRQERIAAIYVVLSQIPKGKVITYGNLAKLAGMPTGARFVGRLMCELPNGSKLPWHRVINSKGKISLPAGSDSYDKQKSRLEKDGIKFVNGKINLAVYGYNN